MSLGIKLDVVRGLAQGGDRVARVIFRGEGDRLDRPLPPIRSVQGLQGVRAEGRMLRH